MRTKITVIIVLASLLMLVGVVVFRFGLDLSWLDSVYFVVTTMMTVGYGDINLQNAPPAVKVFGIVLMLASGALLAATFGLLTDSLIKARIEELLGRRKLRMRNHIVLCGLGHVGVRVLDQLTRMGEQVVVVDNAENNRYFEEAKQKNVPVIMADLRLPSTLERANIKEARSIIAATSDDLVNLEVALMARAVSPDIRVVLRMFDHNLADKICSGFGIKTTFSTAALAAPAFAMAAVDPGVIGSFFVDKDLVLILQLEVCAGAKIDGLTVAELRRHGSLSILCHQPGSGGERVLHPPETLRMTRGDTITVSASAEVCARIKELNVC